MSNRRVQVARARNGGLQGPPNVPGRPLRAGRTALISPEISIWGVEHQIQCLGSSGRENDVFWRCAGKSSHLGPSAVDRGSRSPPFGVNGRGIAAKVEGRAHCVARRWMQRCGGIMIEIDGSPRHEKFRNLMQPYECSGHRPATQTLCIPKRLAIQKRLQSNGAYVREDPSGFTGIARISRS